MKKFLVKLRKIRKMFFLTEQEFDNEYFKKRIHNITDEINEMPLKERLIFVESIKKRVIDTLIKEQAVYKLKYESIKDILKNESEKR